MTRKARGQRQGSEKADYWRRDRARMSQSDKAQATKLYRPTGQCRSHKRALDTVPGPYTRRQRVCGKGGKGGGVLRSGLVEMEQRGVTQSCRRPQTRRMHDSITFLYPPTHLSDLFSLTSSLYWTILSSRWREYSSNLHPAVQFPCNMITRIP